MVRVRGRMSTMYVELAHMIPMSFIVPLWNIEVQP